MNIGEFNLDGLREIPVPGDLPFEARQRVDQFVENIRQMQLKEEALGLNDISARQIAEFIEGRLSRYIMNGEYYLRRENTGLSNTIEFDPLSKKVFIHLKTHGGVALIGKGGQKRITKTIEYGLQPKIHANAVYSCTSEDALQSAKAEVDTLKKLQGKKGIVEVVSISEHASKRGAFPKVQIITKLYNRSSLEQFVGSGEKLTLQQQKNLAVDVLEGCVAMHKEGVIHRDIKPENVFIEETEKGEYKAVIADFGLAKGVRGRSHLSIAHGTPGYVPPFADNLEKLRQRDKKRLDLFPLGSTIATIFTGLRIVVEAKTAKKENKILGKLVKGIKKQARSKKLPKSERKIGKLVADMLETGRKGKVKKAKRSAETYLEKLKKVKVK